MNYIKECAQLTQKYLSEVRGQNVTVEEILTRPRWKQVWFWWLALEHYEGKSPRMSMEDCKNVYGE